MELLIVIGLIALMIFVDRKYYKPTDPTRSCEVYKKRGCPHVDGRLCNMEDCETLKGYLYGKEKRRG